MWSGPENPKKQECHPTEQESFHLLIHSLTKLKDELQLASEDWKGSVVEGHSREVKEHAQRPGSK